MPVRYCALGIFRIAQSSGHNDGRGTGVLHPLAERPVRSEVALESPIRRDMQQVDARACQQPHELPEPLLRELPGRLVEDADPAAEQAGRPNALPGALARFDHHPRPSGDGPTVDVLAPVALRRHEAVQQVVVRPMQLDEVESGLERPRRRLGKAVLYLLDLPDPELARDLPLVRRRHRGGADPIAVT